MSLANLKKVAPYTYKFESMNQELACMILVTSPKAFNWHHAVVLTFQVQVCCYEGGHNSSSLLVNIYLEDPIPKYAY